jgi:hypothetical protein
VEVISVAKFTNEERHIVKSIIATLSLKRIPDKEIISMIYDRTNKMISERTLYELRQSIKRDSYEWYNHMRQDQFAYIHEFKERINEIMDLQKMHHEIIIRNRDNPQIQQTSLAELHRLNVTLSNYFEVAPTVVNGITLPTAPESKTINSEITV